MKGKLSAAYIFLIFFTGSMCFSVFGFAQTALPGVVQKLNAYNNKVLQEKIFLHTDKDFYVAGEILWLKAYYTDAYMHKPLDVSKVCYVEIINNDNKAELQGKISLQQGEASGSFYLPVSLPTGNYTLRAYTNWMKNFDSNLWFKKNITVVNTLKATGQEKDTVQDEVKINFFPEGGNLVDGIETKVAFKISGNTNNNSMFEGYIINSGGDTSAVFSPFKNDIGEFSFTPLAGFTYKAYINMPGKVMITAALPEVYKEGYTLALSRKMNNAVVKINSKIINNTSPADLLLLVHNGQHITAADKITVTGNGNAELLIDISKLEKGISHFTLFNDKGQPLCERLFFLKPDNAKEIVFAGNQKEYKPRTEVNIELADSTFNSVVEKKPAADISVSVVYYDSLLKSDAPTIDEYYSLTSELGGYIADPSYYFSNDPSAETAADILMLTNGWRRFKWEDVLNENYSFITYMPEINGHLVSAKITQSSSGLPAANINTFLSRQGSPFDFYAARTNDKGEVFFEANRFAGNEQVILQTDVPDKKMYKAELKSPFYQTPGNAGVYHSLSLTKEKYDDILNRSISMQVQNIYSSDSLKNFITSNISDTLPFYGGPQVSYMLDDYQRFTTMEEVLREYVREINVTTGKNGLGIKLFNPAVHDFFKGTPLLLLDGVPLADNGKIFSFDPLKVKKIDIISDRYVQGRNAYNGVISFITYDGKGNVAELDPEIISVDYEGLQMRREFYSPIYETEAQIKSRMPDLRNTVYWTPHIRFNKNGKAALNFYTPDKTGTYIINVQGISADGGLLKGNLKFEVK